MGNEDGCESSGKARRDAGKLGQCRNHRRIAYGVEVGFAASAIFELKDGAVVLGFDDVSCIINALVGASVDVGSRDKKVEFLERRGRFTRGLQAVQLAERAFEFGLIIPLAVQHRQDRLLRIGRRPQQTAYVGGIAPEVCRTRKVLPIAQGIRQQDSIDSARG